MALIKDSNVTAETLSQIQTSALGAFDDLGYLAVGTDNTPTDTSDTALVAETTRNAFDIPPIKNTATGTYDFSGLIGLTDSNGVTLKETGLFVSPSAGLMRLRALLPTEVAKTIDKDLSIGIRVTVTAVNDNT